MNVYIYQIYFPTSDKCYIGQTKHLEGRMKKHLRSGSVVCKALYKYDDWQVSILHTCKSRDEASRVEIEEIRNFNSIAPNGYNLTHGGEGNDSLRSEETKNKISSTLKGRKLSKGTKERMRISLKGNTNGAGKNLGNKFAAGNKHSKEADQRKSKAMKENNPTRLLSVRNKISKSLKGKQRLDVSERNRNPSIKEQIKRLKTRISKLGRS